MKPLFFCYSQQNLNLIMQIQLKRSVHKLFKNLYQNQSFCNNLSINRPAFLIRKRNYSDNKLASDQLLKIIQQSNSILVVAGAGLSTQSGIPDFRSPGTGLYDNLQKYELPYPEAIFDINYFKIDPMPFFNLAKELYPGVNYKPNIGHYFIYQLYKHNKLQKLYTQNIDGLERLSGIPSEKLVEAHGSFSSASCTVCHKNHDPDRVKDSIFNDTAPLPCGINRCQGKVKPDIVFFGENLPERFWSYTKDVKTTDLLLVIGTSLEVFPFAAVADAVGEDVPRVLINRVSAGTFGQRNKDLHVEGELTKTIGRLVEELGWKELVDECLES